MKEIKGTSSYFGLNDDVRECQSRESYQDCKTKVLLKAAIDQCGCLPMNLKGENEVVLKNQKFI